MHDMKELERNIDSYIDEHLEEYGELSDWIAANPEIGGEEFKASSRSSICWTARVSSSW